MFTALTYSSTVHILHTSLHKQSSIICPHRNDLSWHSSIMGV